MVALALAALTKIRERVTETGVDADGKKYKGYSTKDMLVGSSSFVKKAAAKTFFAQKDLEWRTIGGSSGYAAMLAISSGTSSGMSGGGKGSRLAILKGGYKKLRELQGRQTAFVDFTVTGDMWKDINVISKQPDHQKGIAIIGARNAKYKDILAGNTKRRGDILDLSKSEIDELKESYNLNVLKIFRQNGL
jgi:hypothetical protein